MWWFLRSLVLRFACVSRFWRKKGIACNLIHLAVFKFTSNQIFFFFTVAPASSCKEQYEKHRWVPRCFPVTNVTKEDLSSKLDPFFRDTYSEERQESVKQRFQYLTILTVSIFSPIARPKARCIR